MYPKTTIRVGTWCGEKAGKEKQQEHFAWSNDDGTS